MSNKRKTVFISYSWDSPEHQEWVLNLAKNLIEKFGINVILDQFELSAGKDLTYFMESSIEEADKVLIILTPDYKLKAEGRKSGVGYETSMITQEIFESPISKVKFIPILRKGSLNISAPKFLKSKVYHQMDDDNLFINKLYDLTRIIYEKTLLEKPKLGKIPNFSKNDIDPIIDIANSLLDEEKINKEIDSILDSPKGVEIFRSETQKLNSLIKEKVTLYKSTTDIPFVCESDDYESIIVHALGYSASFYWRTAYVNSTKNSILLVRYWNGVVRLKSRSGYFPINEPKIVNEKRYHIDLNYKKEIVWLLNKESYNSREIVQSAFLFIIEEIKKEKSKRFRQ
ncbi:toll/interleukin-1 receptor domain-containing protein [Catalinimonas sp. 4WD22]|uniref:toll/interleukin-1 receptor domain-containing protein n=1 Tax=Catalinimonas locisalis TaxID=3133978 RepID=UPI0031017574